MNPRLASVLVVAAAFAATGLAAPALLAQPVPAGPPFLVNQADAGPQEGPAVAVGERGESAFLWFGLCPEFDLCHRAYDAAGVPLGPPAPLDTGSPLLDAVPGLAVGADGHLVAVWSEPGLGFERRIAGRRFVFDGTPLGPKFVVASASAQVFDRPDVAVAPDGDLLVAFERLRFDGYVGEGEEQVPVYTGIEIRGVRLSPLGVPRGATFRVDAPGLVHVASPSLAAAGGEIVVAWEAFSADLGTETVVARRFSDQVAPAPLAGEVPLAAPTSTARRRAPRVAASSQGTFLVAWEDRVAATEPTRVRAQVLTPDELRYPLPVTLGTGVSPAVDGGDGVFLLTFASGLPGAPRFAAARRYDEQGVPLEEGFRVDAPGSPVAPGTVLATDGGLFGAAGLDSGLVAGWQHRDAELAYDVLGRRYPGVLPPPPPCVDGPQTLCLGAGDRFEVEATWSLQSSGVPGPAGNGQRVELTSDTGYFWFFKDTNVEVVVKVLDGCVVNGGYWVFAAGLTDVEVHLAVRDSGSATGLSRTYSNVFGQPFQPIQDTAAFPCP